MLRCIFHIRQPCTGTDGTLTVCHIKLPLTSDPPSLNWNRITREIC